MNVGGTPTGEGFAYWHERDHALDHDHCFLCGCALSDATRTDEHVFPQWLLRDFRLHAQTLNLLNGSRIPYRSLTIPCCGECNTYWLSQIEDRVAVAVRDGPEAAAALEPLTLYLWMAKIYYGILFKEIALPADRRDAQAGAILDPEILRRFGDLHRVLQAARRRVRFDGTPGSVFVFRVQRPTRIELQFDYRDTINMPFLALRAGRVGLVAALLDWGAMREVIEVPGFDAAQRLDLHPMQFLEIVALGAYTASTFDRTPTYLVGAAGDGEDVMHVLLNGLADRPVFRDFQAEEYVHVLAEMLGTDLDQVWDGQNYRSLIRGSDGQPFEMPLSPEEATGAA